MTTSTFLTSIGTGFLASVAAGLFLMLPGSLLAADTALNLAICGGALHLILQPVLQPELQPGKKLAGRAGSSLLLAGWLLLSTLLLLLQAPLWSVALCQVTIVWFTRALFLHTNLFPALLELILVLLCLMTAIATWQHTGSAFLAFWVFFLGHALTTVILSRSLAGTHRGESGTAVDEDSRRGPEGLSEDRFQPAYQTATTALQKIVHKSRYQGDQR